MIGFGTHRVSAILVLAVALVAGIGGARNAADAPKTPDLSDLRDAVSRASKRGENVDEIRTALDALEKALAKGWTAPKPGAPAPTPAELAALRRAVEAAGKKGENVETIVKELALVEKAMTGRAFARIEKGAATTFATEVLKATDLLSKRYAREVDKNELIDRAVDGLYLAAGEKVPDAVIQERSRRAKGEAVDGQRILETAREAIGGRADLTENRDLERTLQHVCAQLDAQTAFMSPDAMARMRAQQYQNGLGEVGLQVRRVANRGVEVVTPYKDGPAYKVGIRAGDAITRVRALDDPLGRPLPKALELTPDTMTDEEFDRVLWGPPNSRVELTVVRPGVDPIPVVFTRVRVKRESLLGHRRNADDTWNHLLDEKTGIYYVRLIDFQRADLAIELAQLMTKLEGQKMKGLVLDLRFAGSGLIDTAVGVADLFIDNELIVEFRGRFPALDRRVGRKPGSRLAFPMVCLVNSTSGTCSDLVAACLQDHKRAVIVGERTPGKASVQNYVALTWGTLRVTSAHAYRPNGKSLDRATALPDRPDEWGVTPDAGFAVELPKAERDALREYLDGVQAIARRDPAKPDPVRAAKDVQLDKALEHLRAKVKPE